LKQNNRFRIGAAALLATVTACGALALTPAAFASTAASATTHITAHSVAATNSAKVRPATSDACVAFLAYAGYPLTTYSAIACGIAASNLPNPHAAVVVCNALLIAIGVNPFDALPACVFGSI